MKLTVTSRELYPRRPFRISRARRNEVRNVFLRLEHDGLCGYGEASPNAFYDETWAKVTAHLEQAREWISALRIETPADIEAAWTEGWQYLAPSRAAQCALDLALWDWLGQRRQLSVSELLWRTRPQPVISFATIGLSTPEELEQKIEELEGFSRIKIKSDATADLATVRRVRERTAATIAIDANCAWLQTDLPILSRELSALQVSFIEQPYPPENDDRVARSGSSLPIFADESCVAEADVERVCRAFDGFNIKLVKCGGLTPARRMAVLGHTLQKKIMVGCMLESSALIAAGAAIAQKTDYADLDGAWLIGDDPFTGWSFDRGTLIPIKSYGLGVEPLPGLFPTES